MEHLYTPRYCYISPLCFTAQRKPQVRDHFITTKWKDEDYVYRVAWRNIRDWIMAQLARYETEIVDMPQVFFPFATAAKGQTLYEKMVDGKFLLGDGKGE
jgi:hypothetical protein